MGGDHTKAVSVVALRKIFSPLYLQNGSVTHINGLIIRRSTLSKKEAFAHVTIYYKTFLVDLPCVGSCAVCREARDAVIRIELVLKLALIRLGLMQLMLSQDGTCLVTQCAAARLKIVGEVILGPFSDSRVA